MRRNEDKLGGDDRISGMKERGLLFLFSCDEFDILVLAVVLL